MEESLTRHYQSTYSKTQVFFQWLGDIQVGGIENRLQPPRPCYPVKLQVKVTTIDPDGRTGTVERGINGNLGFTAKKEVFLFFRNGYNEWEWGSRDP